MFVCMYECIDKKTDECMDVCIHVDECTTFGFMDGLTYICMRGWISGICAAQIDRWMQAWMNGSMYPWMDS